MHWLIPFAGPASSATREAMAGMAWPRLASLLPRLQPAPGAEDAGDEWTLSPPHERALAQALGWRGADGCWPWAARAAAQDGLDLPAGAGVGLLTPAHWHLGTDQVSLGDPEALQLDAADSRAHFDAVRELFTSEGYGLHWGAPLRWYLVHPSLAALPSASLDRVIGRNVDRWLTSEPAARTLRRLQNEVQMLLHEHPLAEARAARGLLPVNSFWLSGCGVAQPETRGAPQIDARLRGPALAENAVAWTAAWGQVEAQTLAAAEAALAQASPASGWRLTLCGERRFVSLVPAPGGLGARLARWMKRADPRALLESL